MSDVPAVDTELRILETDTTLTVRFLSFICFFIAKMNPFANIGYGEVRTHYKINQNLKCKGNKQSDGRMFLNYCL